MQKKQIIRCNCIIAYPSAQEVGIQKLWYYRKKCLSCYWSWFSFSNVYRFSDDKKENKQKERCVIITFFWKWQVYVSFFHQFHYPLFTVILDRLKFNIARNVNTSFFRFWGQYSPLNLFYFEQNDCTVAVLVLWSSFKLFMVIFRTWGFEINLIYGVRHY